MIRHPFTLEHVAQALNLQWKGARIVEAWSQEKFVLTVIVLKNDDLRTYFIDVSPDAGTITERLNAKRARSNTIDVFAEILNKEIVMVTKHPDDRILTVWFSDHHMHIELFSAGKGNVLLTREGVVMDALRERISRINTTFQVRRHDLPEPFSVGTCTVAHSLSVSSLRLGPYYAEEVCRRSLIEGELLVSQLDEVQKDLLQHNASALVQECQSATTYYLLRNSEDIVLSLVPLESWVATDTFSDVLEAIKVTVSERRRNKLFHSRQRELLRKSESDLRRTERSIEGMTSDAAKEGRSQRYRAWADLLLSQPAGAAFGLDIITVTDENGASVDIPLNANKSLIENARIYYDKSRSSATAARSRDERLPAILARRDQERATVERLRSASSISELQTKGPTVTTESLPSRDEANGRFRVFVIDDTHTLYVGKNAANNDELTMRFAKQNDWWFHARGASGSHAVLRGAGGEKIPKPVLERAAAITAYYSQARNASYVSVVYTQRKFVRKPKGANIGAVVLEREQTIMVKPAAPTEGS
ncbi:MAG: NFACT RNA binding domain-containing protein [Candidatus Kapabacteria bacterium]|nr:NFACT RNA binding domain-containing protein [Candidatus Kapabacteria bacterium]